MAITDVLSQRHLQAIDSIERVPLLLRNRRGWLDDPAVRDAYDRLDVIRLRLRELQLELLPVKRAVSQNSITLGYLKEKIRKAMLGPVRFAKREFRGLPRLLEACVVPHKRATRDEIVAAARAFAKTIRPYMSQFTARKYPKTLPADLNRLARQLAEMPDVSELTAKRSAKLREAKELTREGRELIGQLDGVLAPMFASLPVNVGSRAWRDAARLRPRLGRPRKSKRRTDAEALA